MASQSLPEAAAVGRIEVGGNLSSSAAGEGASGEVSWRGPRQAGVARSGRVAAHWLLEACQAYAAGVDRIESL